MVCGSWHFSTHWIGLTYWALKAQVKRLTIKLIYSVFLGKLPFYQKEGLKLAWLGKDFYPRARVWPLSFKVGLFYHFPFLLSRLPFLQPLVRIGSIPGPGGLVPVYLFSFFFHLGCFSTKPKTPLLFTTGNCR